MLVCVFLVHLAHETAGAACIRLSLCPPLLGRVRTDAKLGRMAPREYERAYLPIVIAREGGRSSTPRLLGSSTAASGYWIVRSSRTMTAENCLIIESETLLTSSLRTQGPIPRCALDWTRWMTRSSRNQSRWLWVPAFAGTTRRDHVSHYRSAFATPFIPIPTRTEFWI